MRDQSNKYSSYSQSSFTTIVRLRVQQVKEEVREVSEFYGNPNEESQKIDGWIWSDIPRNSAQDDATSYKVHIQNLKAWLELKEKELKDKGDEGRKEDSKNKLTRV